MAGEPKKRVKSKETLFESAMMVPELVKRSVEYGARKAYRKLAPGRSRRDVIHQTLKDAGA